MGCIFSSAGQESKASHPSKKKRKPLTKISYEAEVIHSLRWSKAFFSKIRDESQKDSSKKGSLFVVRHEVRLLSTTERAGPIIRDLFKWSAGGDTTIGISYFGVIDVPTELTNVLSHNSSLSYCLILLFLFRKQR